MKVQIHKSSIVLILMMVFASLISNAFRPTPTGIPAGRILATSETTVPRFDHTATLLPNGKVLIAGGMERNGLIEPTAELYDPPTRAFKFLGNMKSPHGWGSSAVLLKNGKVLIVGGSSGFCGPSCYLATAEIYDPTSSAFTLTGSMNMARVGACSVLLQTGDVLIVGGGQDSENGSPASAELYNAATGTFSSAGKTRAISGCNAAVPLQNGKIFLIGNSTSGNGGAEDTNAEIYDPSAGKFSSVGDAAIARGKFGVAELPDGQILIAGGQIGGAMGARISSTEIFDPARGRFRAGPSMNFKRFKLRKSVVTLQDGRILIAGGAENPEVYDPRSSMFLPTVGSKLDGFLFSTATLLSNGNVLIVGGYENPGGPGVKHAWIYQP